MSDHPTAASTSTALASRPSGPRTADTGIIAPLSSAMPPVSPQAADTAGTAGTPSTAALPTGGREPDTAVPPEPSAQPASVRDTEIGAEPEVGARPAAAAPRASGPEARRPFRQRRLAALAALLLAGVLAVVAWGALALAHDDSLAAARTSALAAARTEASALVTYQYQHLATDWSVVRHDATASFWRSFSRSSAGLAKALTQYHATSSGQVLAVGLVSATTARAVVLAFVDQRVTSTASTTPTVDESRVELTLVRPDGRWLIDRVELVG